MTTPKLSKDALALTLATASYLAPDGYAEENPPRYSKDAQVAITMSAISYLAEDSPPEEQKAAMNRGLRIPGLPTGDDWDVVWGPAAHGGNLSLVARGPALDSGGFTYAYAVRGTAHDPKNMLEDALDALGLFDLPWPGFPGAKISEGMLLGWKNLTAATSAGKTAVEFLKTVEPQSRLLVTGHSLGGTLASGMALYFYSELHPHIEVVPITFAAMSVGNREFADAHGEKLPGGSRFYNCLDIVPMGWQHDHLVNIKKLYPHEMAPSCSDHLACTALAELLVEIAGHRYFQPPGGVRLQGKVYDEGGGSFKNFLQESVAQHDCNLYMWFLGLPIDAIRELTPQNPPWSPPLLDCECPQDSP